MFIKKLSNELWAYTPKFSRYVIIPAIPLVWVLILLGHLSGQLAVWSMVTLFVLHLVFSIRLFLIKTKYFGDEQK